VEEIRVDNIIMKNIREQAIVLDMQYARTSPEPVSERTPQFRNIHFSNITAQTNQAVFLNGLAEMPIEDISFNDIQFDAQTGITIREAKNIAFHQVRVTTKQGPALTAENLTGLEVDGLKTFNPIKDIPMLSLVNVQDAYIHNCLPVSGTDLFISAKGKDTRDIVIKNNQLKFVQRPLLKEATITENITVE
jgi:hypothetical protein